MSLKGKTLFITGASRGIGLAIALRAARDGANIAIAAKTETPHPKLEGTIYTAAQEIEGRRPGVAARRRASDNLNSGIRIGIIARRTDWEAWHVAMERFPETRKGQITHQLAMKASDSQWHQQLSELGQSADSPYWLGPFQNYNTFCPYLVGAYETVAAEVSRYLALGYETFILDIPPTAEELDSISKVFEIAREQVAPLRGQ